LVLGRKQNAGVKDLIIRFFTRSDPDSDRGDDDGEEETITVAAI
jgi:hypothetical protein